MVYCGRASRACSNCRLRRIRCNLVEPACMQCLRAGKICPGYRDQLSLLFRDESAKVIKKARTLEIPRRCRETRQNEDRLKKSLDVSVLPPSNDFRTPRDAQSSVSTETFGMQFQSSILGSLSLHSLLSSTNLEDLGITFLTCYVAVISPFATAQSSAASSPLFTSKASVDAVSCVGLAGLSNVTNNQDLMMIARHKYAATIRHVGAALQEPISADLDDTFRAVIMLALFEVVNCTSQSRKAWGLHVDGAAALLRTIASKQPPRQPGLRMQLHFCFLVFIRYLQSGQNVPASFSEWSRYCRDSQCPADYPAASLVGIVSRFVELHASIKSVQTPNADIIVRKALLCEAELEEWEATLPKHWEYGAASPREPESRMFDGQYYIYRDIWMGRILDHYRWSRILVNEILLIYIGKIAPCPLEYNTQRTKSLAIISQMASEICVSVSGQLYCHTLPISKIRLVPATSGFFLLLFAVAVAGSSFGVSEKLHGWVAKLLEEIGHKMGIRRALMLVPAMKMQRERWAQDVEALPHHVMVGTTREQVVWDRELF